MSEQGEDRGDIASPRVIRAGTIIFKINYVSSRVSLRRKTLFAAVSRLTKGGNCPDYIIVGS